ncbi:hypothetical protein IHV12_08140 [Fictibacillus sp. 7GRE50]|uniref:hypothetical protein n=1 Tax=Fictibacillus sp. 7GRE50 TaxID=2745878 RepID=UPI0018CCCA8A|nr:hypothetical protein [Fictibacillus sp. 7GRE50]MBH0164884.1 hypothetical protein [Fictibacillus sp. 7GRE50]
MREKGKFSSISLLVSACTVAFFLFIQTYAFAIGYWRLIVWVGVLTAMYFAFRSPKNSGFRGLAIAVSIILAIPLLLMEMVGLAWRNGGFGN